MQADYKAKHAFTIHGCGTITSADERLEKPYKVTLRDDSTTEGLADSQLRAVSKEECEARWSAEVAAENVASAAAAAAAQAAEEGLGKAKARIAPLRLSNIPFCGARAKRLAPRSATLLSEEEKEEPEQGPEIWRDPSHRPTQL